MCRAINFPLSLSFPSSKLLQKIFTQIFSLSLLSHDCLFFFLLHDFFFCWIPKRRGKKSMLRLWLLFLFILFSSIILFCFWCFLSNILKPFLTSQILKKESRFGILWNYPKKEDAIFLKNFCFDFGLFVFSLWLSLCLCFLFVILF